MIEPSQDYAKWAVPPLLRRGALMPMLLMLVAATLAGQVTPIDDFRCPES
jgi:hypothetical protein